MKSEFLPQLRSVLLRKQWLIPAILPLSDEDAGRLIKAICGFWAGEDIYLEDQQQMTIFTTIAEAMEGSAKRFIEKRVSDTTERSK